MKNGDSPKVACEKAVLPIKKFYPKAEGALICLNAKGEYGGAKINYPYWSFSARDGSMDEVREIPV